ncbi:MULTISPECIES: hypothetical protein [unclassified Rhizobium]|uniref:hypothetical protein n=1 Tax=unclassified Rhizobium TaxID=2613769 RepID=UPI0016750094|nr:MULTISPECIES: hypothetical protein [unclassified Rhizobium]
MRKGMISIADVAVDILRNAISDIARIVWPEPLIDLKGRAKGHLLAVADLMRGRLEPERAAAISPRQPIGLPACRHEAL